MFDTRYNAAMKSKDTWKISSSTKVNELKRSYKLVTSTRSYVTVDVCNIASCSCCYYEKEKDRVWCKHILFVIMIALGGSDLETQLQEKFICEEDLKNLFVNNIHANFLAPKVNSRTKAELCEILNSHPLENQEQNWLYHSKTDRYAGCSSYPCKKRITVGTNCFSVIGAIGVVFGTNEAKPRKFYFCADNERCVKWAPGWGNNIRLPTSFDSEETRLKIMELDVISN